MNGNSSNAGSRLYYNRELSWLGFNRRVLEEAQDETNQLLERVKFLAISSSNLDEFFEVRVAGTMELVDSGLPGVNPDGLSSTRELDMVRAAAAEFSSELHRCWRDQLVPALADAGIHFPQIEDLKPKRRKWLRQHFRDQVFPVLTPLAVDPAHPFPWLVNKSLNLAVLLNDVRGSKPLRRMAIVQIPRALPRLVRIGGGRPEEHVYLFLGALVRAHVAELFPGLEVVQACTFRITRNSNLELDEDVSEDLLHAIEKELVKRRRGEPVRLEISSDAHPDIVEMFRDAFELEPEDIYECEGPVNLGRLMALYRIESMPHLKDPHFSPRPIVEWPSPEAMFADLRSRDILLHHPYDAFSTVEEFIGFSTRDPHVLAIKMTIYRIGVDPSIVRDLIEAAKSRKQVTVVVELQARFDEEANIRVAKRMEQAGIHVVYGVVGYKTHAKACLIVRREEHGELRRYCHLSTGNYNSTTAKLYTDIGLLSARSLLTEDVANLFNTITGYTRVPLMNELVLAPFRLRSQLLEWIDREIENHRAGQPAQILAKMNSLADAEIISKLYQASQAGVKIRLCVRGICCLRPGIPDLSENIEVISIVDRFLEHTRVYYFENGGDPQVYLSSADWMQRNLSRRIEATFPILDPALKRRVISETLEAPFRDNVQARRILPDGSHERVKPKRKEMSFRLQGLLMERVERRSARAADGDSDDD